MNIKSYKDFQNDAENGTLNGFYANVPNEDYHKSPGISKSGLDLINKSPAHYKFAPPRKPSAAMHIGTAIHTAILEPVVFQKDYMCLENIDDKRKSEYKEAVKEFGKEFVLTASESANIKGMQEALTLNHDANELITSIEYAELSCYATDINGVLLKCRFDGLTTDGIAIDLKKTRDASARGFSKSVAEYRYHLQEAFYRYVYALAAGVPLERFVFIAVEDNAPYYSKVWQLDHEAANIGLHEANKDIQAYTIAYNDDYWPLPDGGTELLSLPSWKISQYEEELEQEIK